MPNSRIRNNRLIGTVLWAAILVLLASISGPIEAAPGNGSQGSAPAGEQQSRITYVTIAGSEPAGSFGGVAYKRTWGTVAGV
ncbi:MAG TPA: hypothetical protein VG272_01890, partial [Candidatus Acidoferrales bacterium]|nr:hypothetical protein [Candidatus Acidoferrales bacterium]